MGTMLQNKGLKSGEHPELAALEHPDWLFDIHRAYVDAGAQIINTNTFGANREKLARTGKSVAEVVSASAAVARKAADSRALVALDVGPIGQLLEPTGTLAFEQAVDIFKETITAGVTAGVDLIFIETITDLQEARAALLAAKETCDLPVMVTMTYEARCRTFLGHSPAAAALTLEGMGADAIGVNCSLGPREMPPLAEELLRWSTLPIILKPNAGLPDPAGGGYDITPAEFAQNLAALVDMGIKLFGGCCGTTPEYIALLKQELDKRSVSNVARSVPAAVCSPTTVVPIDRVRVIGERINPTGKKLMKEALRRGDVDFMLGQALAQTQAGADILDVNVGLPDIDEQAMMVRTVKALQGITDAPLQLDSTDPTVLEQALRVYCGKAIVNSVNGEQAVLDRILPLVKKYGAAVVGHRPAYSGRGTGLRHPKRGRIHRLPHPYRFRRAGGRTANPVRPAYGQRTAGAENRTGCIQHFLRSACPACGQSKFPDHGHGIRSGPAHHQPQRGQHDGGSTQLSSADERGHRCP